MFGTACTTGLNSTEIMVQPNEMTIQAELKMVMVDTDTGVKGQNKQANIPENSSHISNRSGQ